nr:VWA domain-containing protein [Thermoleophilaceae bacterium]
LPALSLRFVAFDTSVVDLTDDLDDPVDLLFGVQLGGGTDIDQALALSDDGAPAHDHANAQHLASLGAPVFACTPDLFPDLMAAAIERRDVSQWAARHDVAVTPERA